MFRDHRANPLKLIALAAILGSGCIVGSGCIASDDLTGTPPGSDPSKDPGGGGGPGGSGSDPSKGPIDGLPSVVESGKARLSFKGGERYANLLSEGLALARGELCKELGSFDCVSDVHRITLGGVEPYRAGILDPLPRVGLTAPLAADRVALSACSRRAELDFTTAEKPAIFALALDGERLRDVAGTDVAGVVDTLYKRLVQRRAEPREVEHLRDLYRELDAAGAKPLAKQWATLACFSVATTTEALFY